MPEEAVVDSVSPDFTAKMDSIFSSPPDIPSDTTPAAAPQSAEPTAPPEPPAAPAGEEPPQGDQPKVEEPADPNAQPPATEEVAPELDDDEIDIAKMEAEGRKYAKVDMPRFKRVYDGYKFARDVQEFAPSIEVAKGHWQAYNDMRSLFADYSSGNERGAQSFLNYWKENAPEAYNTLAAAAARSAPEVVQQLQGEAITRQIEDMYYAAKVSGDAHDLYAAQKLDFQVTGDFRKPEDVAKIPVRQQADPLTERERRVAAQEQTIREQNNRIAENTWRGYQNSVYQGIDQQLRKEIDDALKPALDAYKGQPKHLAAIRSQAYQEITSAIKANEEWQGQFAVDFGAARRAMTPQNRQTLIDAYMYQARRHIRPAVRPLVNQTTARVVKDNQAEHTVRGKSQDRREVMSGGRPAPQRLPASPQGMTLDDKFANLWREVDGR